MLHPTRLRSESQVTWAYSCSYALLTLFCVLLLVKVCSGLRRAKRPCLQCACGFWEWLP